MVESWDRTVKLSGHMGKRLRQRGFKEADVPLILRVATEEPNGCYKVTARAVEREIARLKAEIAALERLSGCVLILEHGTAVTIHHDERRKRSRQPRRRRRGRTHERRPRPPVPAPLRPA